MKHTKMILVLAGGALSVSGLNALADSTTVNKDEVRAIVAEMLADAQSRSSLLQGQGNAGAHVNSSHVCSSDPPGCGGSRVKRSPGFT